MPEGRGSQSFDPGDPHGLRLFRHSLFWVAGIMGSWATMRVLLLGRNYETYYTIALVLFVVAVIIEPLVDRLRRRREPF